ncbi:unnamed protein product [Thlaspi arvense]|uniref:Uncharacterized protein n=1 Tax=Thlaspi arvense TaxID=13288 RepID=A0AAU9RSR2_THLAR|nr:unnamed protein product [Thlaspi arvense]
MEHLLIFHSRLRYYHCGKVSSEVVFEFSSTTQDLDILECGAQINESEPSEEDDTEGGVRTYEEICESNEERESRRRKTYRLLELALLSASISPIS